MAYAEIPETAERPTRGTPGEVFMNMPGWYKTRHPEVMRHRWLRTDFEDRGLFDGPVNPVRMEVDDPGGPDPPHQGDPPGVGGRHRGRVRIRP